jgi:hypothetical protein
MVRMRQRQQSEALNNSFSVFSVLSVVNSYPLITARAIRLRRFERVRRAGGLCHLGW